MACPYGSPHPPTPSPEGEGGEILVAVIFLINGCRFSFCKISRNSRQPAHWQGQSPLSFRRGGGGEVYRRGEWVRQTAVSLPPFPYFIKGWNVFQFNVLFLQFQQPVFFEGFQQLDGAFHGDAGKIGEVLAG
jgi:hypothetical protein